MVELPLKIDRGHIRRRLAGSGCCHRCLRRFEPFFDVVCPKEGAEEGKGDNRAASAGSIESDVDDQARRNGAKLNGVSLDDAAPCFVCLDILGQRHLGIVTRFVRDEIEKANYESSHFFLSLVTIQVLEIRQILLALWLKDDFPSLSLTTFMDHVTPVKQLLKDDLVSLLPDMLRLQYRNDSAFDVKLEIDVADTDFFRALERLDPDAFVMKTKRQQRAKKTISQIFSRKSVLRFFAKHSTETLKDQFPFPSEKTPSTDLVGVEEPFVFRLTLEHEPIFIGGRYNKYTRDLPQTPWIVEGVRLKESSIEELIVGPIKEALPADDFKFSSSGREDVDVRCLGEGRPFVVECLNPRRTHLTGDELKRIQTKVNELAGDKIRVGNLAMVSERETAYLRKMENEKGKHYAAECHSVEKLSQNDMVILRDVHDLLVQQKTPLRVLHRRVLAVRPRRILSIYQAELVDDYHFRIGLETEAGTYIKEFVHGDLGRTQPNLKEILGKEVDILKLDVEKVDVVWPLPPGFDLGDVIAGKNLELSSDDEPDS